MKKPVSIEEGPSHFMFGGNSKDYDAFIEFAQQFLGLSDKGWKSFNKKLNAALEESYQEGRDSERY